MSLDVRIPDRTDPRLGRIMVHDSRSKQFPVSFAVQKTYQDIIHADKAPILNQKDVGGCVGFTGADLLNMEFFATVRNLFNKGQFYDNNDGLNFYHLSTVADNIKGTYPPNDTGSSGLGLAKAFKKLGLIKNYEHAFTWAHLQAAIAVQPLALGTLWTNDMFDPDKDGVIHVGSLDDSNIAGGHEWSLRGISYTKGLALGRNHWDRTWDKQNTVMTAQGGKLPGEFWIPIPDLQKLLLDHQGDVTVLRIS